MTYDKILKSMLNVHTKGLVNLSSSLYGFLLFALATLGAFFGPERYAFVIVLVAILLDAFFGTLVSIKRGNFVLSKLGRVTTLKITSYGAALVIVFMVEKLVHDVGFIGVKVAAGWAVACEFWSLSASVLIIWPEAYFFRILRRQLKGEISAKLGKGIDDILPEGPGYDQYGANPPGEDLVD